jgi:hypothetical protein
VTIAKPPREWSYRIIDDMEGVGMKRLHVIVLASCLGLAVFACRQEGPAEKTGKEIDKAAKEMGQAMERAADSVRESTKSK